MRRLAPVLLLLSSCALLRGGKSHSPVDAEAWRAQRPAPGKPPDLKLPMFQKATLKNGLTVLVSEQPELPVVTFSVAFRAGSTADPKGKAGLADLTYATMLLEGAGKYEALEIADAFGTLGATPYQKTERDGASVDVTVLRRNADAALALLGDVVLRPKLARAGFDRKKKQQLAELAEALGEPAFLQKWALASAVFGDDNPHAHVPRGEPKSVASLTLEDVKGFYSRNVGPAGTALVVSGQVNLADATAWAEKIFGGWSAKATVPPPSAVPTPQPRKQVVLVPKEGLNQTTIALGRVGVRADDPDFAPLAIADAIFGGTFSSRLNLNLREAKGYTYGAFSFVDSWRATGIIAAGAAVRADVTGPSLTEVFAELDGLKKHPITSKEVEDAREGLVRALPGYFDTTESLASTAVDLYLRDEPLDRYQRLVAEIRAADLARVQAIALKYYEPGLMQLVLVGDAELCTKQVPPLSLGAFTVKAPPPAATK